MTSIPYNLLPHYHSDGFTKKMRDVLFMTQILQDCSLWPCVREHDGYGATSGFTNQGTFSGLIKSSLPL